MIPGTMASDDERAKLAALTADPPPRLVGLPAPADRAKHQQYRQPHVVAAPAYDEEHPEELSYRPFPIAPFLTVTASADDPALAGMVHPNLAKILETMDQDNVPPMRLRPGLQAALMLWSQQFKGEAINLSGLADADLPADGPPPGSRKVATQAP